MFFWQRNTHQNLEALAVVPALGIGDIVLRHIGQDHHTMSREDAQITHDIAHQHVVMGKGEWVICKAFYKI